MLGRGREYQINALESIKISSKTKTRLHKLATINQLDEIILILVEWWDHNKCQVNSPFCCDTKEWSWLQHSTHRKINSMGHLLSSGGQLLSRKSHFVLGGQLLADLKIKCRLLSLSRKSFIQHLNSLFCFSDVTWCKESRSFFFFFSLRIQLSAFFFISQWGQYLFW